MANEADFPTESHIPVQTSGYANKALGESQIPHADIHEKVENELKAIGDKLGKGESNAADATPGQVLTRKSDGTTGYEDPSGGAVDSVNGMTGDVEIPTTNGYLLQDGPDYTTSTDYVYVGYEHNDGRWYIYRRTVADNSREYASGSSNYSTNWADRESLVYA